MVVELREVRRLSVLLLHAQENQRKHVMNVEIAFAQQKFMCVYPPFGGGGEGEGNEKRSERIRTKCILYQNMESDVNSFVKWNSALDLQLPGGYMRAAQSIPGLAFMLARDESLIVRQRLIQTLKESSNKAHQRRITVRAGELCFPKNDLFLAVSTMKYIYILVTALTYIFTCFHGLLYFSSNFFLETHVFRK